MRISRQMLDEINRRAGLTLIRRISEKNLGKIGKFVPVIGRLWGGVAEFRSCENTAAFARELFQMNQLDT